jgi:hypothetical protein
MRKLAALLTITLAGCTTAKTMMLNDRTALISGRDSGWGDQADVRRKILVTAAQMAKARGFELFQIVGVEDATKSGVVPIMGQSTSNTYGSASCYGYTCTGQATTNSYGTPAYLAPYTMSGADVTVRFYHPGEIDPGAASLYDAAAILSQN